MHQKEVPCVVNTIGVNPYDNPEGSERAPVLEIDKGLECEIVTVKLMRNVNVVIHLVEIKARQGTGYPVLPRDFLSTGQSTESSGTSGKA